MCHQGIEAEIQLSHASLFLAQEDNRVLTVHGGFGVCSTLDHRSFFSVTSSKTASSSGGVGRRFTEASTRARTPAMDNPANPNIHTIVKAQIVFLLSTLTEENFERNQMEIRSVSCLFLRP